MSEISYSNSTPGVTEDAASLMRQTGLWTRIVSVFFFIGLGMMFLGGIGMAIFGAAVARNRDAPPFIIMGITYTLMTLIYIMPAIFLSQYASRAKSFSRAPDERGLARALRAQKSFWKYLAIMMMIVTVIYLIAIPVIVVLTILTNK